MLFDERKLKHEGFNLITNFDPLHGVSRSNHRRSTRVQLLWVLEVTRQTRTKICGFTHVDHSTIAILELI